MARILFLTTNNGTDMRLLKEVNSLSLYHEITFVGFTSKADNHFLPGNVKSQITKGKNKVIGMIFFYIRVLRLLLTRHFDYIHVIDEKLLILFYVPLFFRRKLVLDLFDSLFLRKNLDGEKALILKYLLYSPLYAVIVTDKNRFNLLPSFVKKKAHILPNYPNRFTALGGQTNFSKVAGKVNVIFYGWLGMNRGGFHARQILNDDRFHLHMAGWFSDSETKEFIECENVTYYGVIGQNAAMNLAGTCGDLILCTYMVNNINQKFASPNKIYDAIQVRVPILINKEVVVSEFVERHKIGIVIDYFSDIRDIQLEPMNANWDRLAEEFCWERCSKVLGDIYI